MTSEFQQAASAQGKQFEDVCEFVLQAEGWNITGRHVKVEGVEVDIVADDPDGIEWWIECKGSYRGKVPGSKRGDTVKKALGVAWFFSTLPDRRKYMLLTSHMPTAGTASSRMLEAALDAKLFDRIAVIGTGVGFAEDLPEDDE